MFYYKGEEKTFGCKSMFQIMLNHNNISLIIFLEQHAFQCLIPYQTFIHLKVECQHLHQTNLSAL